MKCKTNFIRLLSHKQDIACMYTIQLSARKDRKCVGFLLPIGFSLLPPSHQVCLNVCVHESVPIPLIHFVFRVKHAAMICCSIRLFFSLSVSCSRSTCYIPSCQRILNCFAATCDTSIVLPKVHTHVSCIQTIPKWQHMLPVCQSHNGFLHARYTYMYSLTYFKAAFAIHKYIANDDIVMPVHVLYIVTLSWTICCTLYTADTYSQGAKPSAIMPCYVWDSDSI